MKKFYSMTLLIVLLITISCNNSKNNEMVKKELFGTHNGKEVYLLSLTNKAGNVAKITTYGARLTWLEVPDRDGKKANIILGYDSCDETIKGDLYFGATIGRYANRIANAKFTLDGVNYTLNKNNGPNTLHGGPAGWWSVLWNAEIIKDKYPKVKFSYVSPDMEEGFPGTVKAEVTYTWTDNNELIIDYVATTDKKTVINLTNHAYFNLHGAGNGNILDHELVLKASAFTPVDSVLIPTGELRQVAGTPFDFTSPHAIGERIGDKSDKQLVLGLGYDHNYCLDGKEEVDATLYDPKSGRFMEIITDEPGIQLYTGNQLTGTVGHGGIPYTANAGMCLETDHFPDSPNQPQFPSTVLNPGETFKSTTIHRFSVK
jgi:aldose 1-epimerase